MKEKVKKELNVLIYEAEYRWNYGGNRRLWVRYPQFVVPADMRHGPKLLLPYITQLIQHGNQSLHEIQSIQDILNTANT
jgi:hypothetical protein